MKWVHHSLAIIIIALSTGCTVELTDDSVLSQHIVEADDTTAQDTNTGSGVKTEHIQHGSITAPKIGYYQNVAIVAHSGGDYTDPAEAMQNVEQWCEAALTCLVKIMPGVYNIGERSVHMREGVDIEGSGVGITRIIGSINSYDAGVVTGASNAELRFLTIYHSGGGDHAIGIYNRGTSPRITQVNVRASDGDTLNIGIFNVEDAAPTILHVKTQATGGKGALGIENFNAGAVHMESVEANAMDATDANHAIRMYRSSVTINNSIAIANGGKESFGIGNAESSSQINHVTASASGGTVHSFGVYNAGESETGLRIDHSAIFGTTFSIDTSSGAITYVGSTKLNGDVNNFGAQTICAGAYNGAYVPLNTDCQ